MIPPIPEYETRSERSLASESAGAGRRRDSARRPSEHGHANNSPTMRAMASGRCSPARLTCNRRPTFATTDCFISVPSLRNNLRQPDAGCSSSPWRNWTNSRSNDRRAAHARRAHGASRGVGAQRRPPEPDTKIRGYLYAMAALDGPARWRTSNRLNPASPHQPRKSAPE